MNYSSRVRNGPAVLFLFLGVVLTFNSVNQTEPLLLAEAQAIVELVQPLVAYQLPHTARVGFLDFHRYLTSPPLPSFIEDAKGDEKAKRWCDRLSNGILGDTQNSLACAFYHYDRIVSMEHAVIAAIGKTPMMDRIREMSSGLALGNTIAIDAEYQAFILAARRCLDYLTRSLAAFFRSEFHSFRKFGDFLSDREPLVISSMLKSEHAIYRAKFAKSLLSAPTGKSIRDLITHYEYVSAGCLNINSQGVFFAGGAEHLGSADLRIGRSLSRAIRDHKELLDACVNHFLMTFVTACRKHFHRPK